MLYEYLKSNYALGEPIFTDDIEMPGMTEGNLRYHLKKLTDDGSLCRFEPGVYYFPKMNIFGEPMPLSADTVAVHKYIIRRGKRVGYYRAGVCGDRKNTNGDRDYNAYHFFCNSVFGLEDSRLPQFVKSETAQRSLKRYSRHLYDLFKLNNQVVFDNALRKLIKEIRSHRAGMSMCLSAQVGVDVEEILIKFCGEEFYKEDYQAITSHFAADYVAYEDVIENIRKIVNSGFFKE